MGDFRPGSSAGVEGGDFDTRDVRAAPGKLAGRLGAAWRCVTSSCSHRRSLCQVSCGGLCLQLGGRWTQGSGQLAGSPVRWLGSQLFEKLSEHSDDMEKRK